MHSGSMGLLICAVVCLELLLTGSPPGMQESGDGWRVDCSEVMSSPVRLALSTAGCSKCHLPHFLLPPTSTSFRLPSPRRAP